MISEPIETYSKVIFDYDGHIALFLHTSASYLDVTDNEQGVSYTASASHNEEV
jgi:hypothetical protein